MAERGDAAGGQALELHTRWAGKIEVTPRITVGDDADLSMVYAPYVAAPCTAIRRRPECIWQYTRRWNTVAVVTDGSAVLGLGDIGAEAALPLLEGKAALLKQLGGLDAVPILLSTRDVDEMAKTLKTIASTFGGINFEGISAGHGLELEKHLKQIVDIPVLDDRRQGIAVAVLARALCEAKRYGVAPEKLFALVSGADTVSMTCAMLLSDAGITCMVLHEMQGKLYSDLPSMQALQSEGTRGLSMKHSVTLEDALEGTDIWVNLSAPSLVTDARRRIMPRDSFVLTLNELMDETQQAPQLLLTPGLLRAALDVRADDISQGMLIAAAHALSDLAMEQSPARLPSVLDPRVAPAVAAAVRQAALEEGLARSL